LTEQRNKMKHENKNDMEMVASHQH